MIPPLTTAMLRTALETQRRADAALRWNHAFASSRPPYALGRRDIPVAVPRKP